MSAKLQKAIRDLTTGEEKLVDLTPEEQAEVEARVAAAQAAQLAKDAERQAEREVLASRPSAEAINGATKVSDLKDHLLNMQAVLEILIRRSGLDG